MQESVVSVKQFLDKRKLDSLFALATEFQSSTDWPQSLKAKIIATLFYEPSTRTRFSFEAAVYKLGGSIISTENAAEFSSAIKGESLEDSIRTINGYADGIVMRHPHIGAAQAAAKVSDVPIFNAGDGGGEHPTQALLDLYTIIREKGKVDGLQIGLVGDLLHGRTIHSLVYLLSLYKVTIHFIAPKQIHIPKMYTDYLREHKVPYKIDTNWEKVVGELDVIYMTRIQKERFKNSEDYQKVMHSFCLDKATMKRVKGRTIIMHPLPRNTEISPEIDDDPRSAYFRQAQNGLFVRMALLHKTFARTNRR